MKENRGRTIYDHDGGHHRRFKYFYDYEHVEERSIQFLCAHCFTILGTIDYRFSYIYTMKSKDISDDVMYNDIIPRMKNLNTIQSYCKCCGEYTTHFSVDYNMGEIIRMLNLSGVYTDYSCEGHNMLYDVPYIAFSRGIEVPDYFDMENPLLNHWHIDEFPNNYAIYVNDDSPIDYIRNKKYLKDMKSYVKKYIYERGK